MSLNKVLVLDGVTAVCRFATNGVIMEAEGMLSPELMERMAQFAQWYRRLVSSNIVCCPGFTQMRGWSPSRGWIAQGAETDRMQHRKTWSACLKMRRVR